MDHPTPEPHEGECERALDHDGPHYDGIHTWHLGGDDIDLPEDQAQTDQFDGEAS